MGRRGPKPSSKELDGIRSPNSRPICPAFLGKLAREQWVAVTKQLEEMGILSAADTGTIAAYCQQYAQWCRAAQVIEEKGPMTKRGAHRPELALANRALQNLRDLSKQLLLTPLTRAGIRALKPRKPEKTGMRKILEEARKDH